MEQSAGETRLFFISAAANGRQLRKGNDQLSFCEFSGKEYAANKASFNLASSKVVMALSLVGKSARAACATVLIASSALRHPAYLDM